MLAGGKHTLARGIIGSSMVTTLDRHDKPQDIESFKQNMIQQHVDSLFDRLLDLRNKIIRAKTVDEINEAIDTEYGFLLDRFNKGGAK